MKNKYLLPIVTPLLFLLNFSIQSKAQDGGHLSGDIMLNTNFFERDTAIGAGNNELYDNFLSGGESWMSLRYSNYGFTGFMRIDAFANSNLKNPLAGMSGFGIGAWNVNKEINNLNMTAGYIYDQIGSGILFRTYEDRGLLIDNALVGVQLKYKLKDNIEIKGATGQQKNVFERFQPIIKALSIETSNNIKDKIFLTTGVGALNRTLDKQSMDNIINTINNKPIEQRFIPKYNTYAFTLYNTLSVGNLSWYAEGAYKTSEAISDYDANLINKNGTVLFSTLSYAQKGFAVNIMGKRTENFLLRTSPEETQPNGGMLNWQPIIAQIRTQRVISRYMPQSQDLSEMSFNGNVLVSPNDDYDISLSYTHINTLEDVKLYREIYFETNIRSIKNTLLDVGVHYMQYNQDFYQFKPGVPIVEAITPFAELTYMLTETNSAKFQVQYMHTKQDFGSWLFAGIEYALSSRFSVAISDMYNIKPAKATDKDRHYYNFFVSYNTGPHRVSIAYAKQVEGINCTGGVCRYEPAFSGVRMMITSSF